MRTKAETRSLKDRVWGRYKENCSTDFRLHNELLDLSCFGESLVENEDPDTFGFEELLFAVEKDWLITHLNLTTNDYWTADKVKKWLKMEYTSDEAAAIFKAAIMQRAVIMLEFN